MPEPTLLALAASESVKTVVKPLFSKFIEPHLDVINGWFKEHKLNNKIELFESEFIEYLGSVYNDTQFMNILIFPNEQIPLDEFYEPLYLVTSNNKETHKIDKLNLNFLVDYKKIIVSDNAGMGKSTIMKWISRQCVTKNLGVPILIELKKINTTNGVIQEIFNQLGQLGSELNSQFVTKLLSLGKFIIIFDGFDEIAQDNIDFTTNEINAFISKANKNYFILTSRPDPILSTFGKFKGFHIKPLTPAQYNSIIRKCDKYSPEQVAEELISDLEKRGKDIVDFLTNPFLVTLLYNCYVYNKNIPVNKSSFYDEIYTALYKRHDLSKDKFERTKCSGLDIYNFRLVLRKFAFNSAKVGVVDFSEASLIDAIKVAQESLPGLPAFNAIAFYEDLIKQVPLMVRDGLHIKWSHKSLQDYFAAESICNSESKAKFASSIFNSTTFYRNANLFDFLVELDYGLIREHVLYNILAEFRDFAQRIKEQNTVLTNDMVAIIASSLFSSNVLIGIGLEPGKTDFLAVRNLAKVDVSGYSTWQIEAEKEQKLTVIVTNNKINSLFSMIKSKNKEDIFLSPKPRPHNQVYRNNLVLNKVISMKKKLLNLSEKEILENQDEKFQAELTDFFLTQAVNHNIKLDYAKSMIALRDIESQRNKRLQEDEESF